MRHPSRMIKRQLDHIRLNSQEFKSEVRSQLAASCLNLALEHQKSLVMLIS